MKTHTEKTLKLLVLSAMFAAMTTVLTFFIKIPTAGGGYIHLGDAVIYLAACFLPTPYAMLSAGVGGALSDLFGGYFVYLFPTFLIKALIALPFSRKAEKILTSRNACMVLPAGVITVAGYYLTKVFLLAFDQATTSQGFGVRLQTPLRGAQHWKTSRKIPYRLLAARLYFWLPPLRWTKQTLNKNFCRIQPQKRKSRALSLVFIRCLYHF